MTKTTIPSNGVAKSLPDSQPLSPEIITEILRGNLLTIQGCVDRFQKTFFGDAREYSDGRYPGDPDTFFNWGLPHIWVDHQGERFALIHPEDFPVFMDRICDTTGEAEEEPEGDDSSEEITFDQALHRILSEKHDPALVAEQEARRTDPRVRLGGLEFRMFVAFQEAAELLNHEEPEIRARVGALLQASRSVLSEVEAGTSPIDPHEMMQAFQQKQEVLV